MLRLFAHSALVLGVNQRAIRTTKSVPRVFMILSKGILFLTLVRGGEFVDAVGFFKIIRHSLFGTSLVLLPYRRLVELDWNDVHAVRWFPDEC